jgi:hypothetical protein
VRGGDELFGKLWEGGYSLPVAFCGFFCGGVVAWVVLFFMVFAASRFYFYSSAAYSDVVVDPTPLALIICSVPFHAYLVVASVGVWRSAEPYWESQSGRVWAGAARVVVTMWLANVAVWSVNATQGLIALIAS